MDIPATLDALVSSLRAVGVEADTDGSALNLPGVWVSLDRLTDPTLGGEFATVRARLWLAVPPHDTPRSLAALSELLDNVMFAVPPMSDVETGRLGLQDNTEAPALTYTYDIPTEG